MKLNYAASTMKQAADYAASNAALTGVPATRTVSADRVQKTFIPVGDAGQFVRTGEAYMAFRNDPSTQAARDRNAADANAWLGAWAPTINRAISQLGLDRNADCVGRACAALHMLREKSPTAEIVRVLLPSDGGGFHAVVAKFPELAEALRRVTNKSTMLYRRSSRVANCVDQIRCKEQIIAIGDSIQDRGCDFGTAAPCGRWWISLALPPALFPVVTAMAFKSKEAQREYRARYQLEHREELRLKHAIYNASHHEQIVAYRRQRAAKERAASQAAEQPAVK